MARYDLTKTITDWQYRIDIHVRSGPKIPLWEFHLAFKTGFQLPVHERWMWYGHTRSKNKPSSIRLTRWLKNHNATTLSPELFQTIDQLYKCIHVNTPIVEVCH